LVAILTNRYYPSCVARGECPMEISDGWEWLGAWTVSTAPALLACVLSPTRPADAFSGDATLRSSWAVVACLSRMRGGRRMLGSGMLTRGEGMRNEGLTRW
jgi:hypothetical protein